MSDTKLWIDKVGFTATITGVNVSYTMPLWVFEGIRDFIVTEAEKKVEVTNRDFDTQQELLDRYKAENEKLRQVASLAAEYISHDRCEGCVIKIACNNCELDECWMTTELRNQLRELGVEAE